MTLNGQTVPAVNGFYAISDIKEQDINGVKVTVPTLDTYFFDKLSNMVTGWVHTADDKWSFFKNMRTMDEGKMIIGWKKIENIWYFFMEDGIMLRNGMTPDGCFVDNNGAWITSATTS